MTDHNTPASNTPSVRDDFEDGVRLTDSRPMDGMPREFPLGLVNLLCDQGKFSQAEELTQRWINRKEWEYEQMHGAHSGI